MVFHPLANVLERGKNTIQQTFNNVSSDFSHHRRRRVDTEQVFNPRYERVNDVGFNPSTRVIEEISDAFCKARPHITASLLYISPHVFAQQGSTERVNDMVKNPRTDIHKSFANRRQKVPSGFLPVLPRNFRIPPVLNVSTDTAKEPAKELNCGTDSRAKKGEYAGCNTTPVNVGHNFLDVRPKVFAHLRPVVAFKPLRSFIKCAFDAIAYLSCKLSPVNSSQCAQDEIKLQCEPPHNDPTNEGSIHLLKRTVQHGCHVFTQLVEVHFLEEVVGGLHRSIDTPAQFATNGSVVNAVNDLIHLTANQSSQFLPVRIVESLFQFIGKIANTVINGKFLKHGTVVSTTAATSTAACIILLHDDVQFVNARGCVTNFLCRLCSGTACLFQRVPVRGSVLLCRRKAGSTRKPCEQHIDEVQQGYNFINHKVDCRGKRIDDRRSHSTKTVLEILSAGSKPVHALGECATHESAILIEVVDTLPHGLHQLGEHKANGTVHSNSLHTAKQFTQARSILLNLCGKRRTQRVLEFAQCCPGFCSHHFYFRQSISQLMQCARSNRKPFRKYTTYPVKDRLEYPGSLGHLGYGLRRFLHTACSLLNTTGSGFCTGFPSRGVHRRCNTRGRNLDLRDFHIPNFLQFPQRLT